jgi:hypothetical protein
VVSIYGNYYLDLQFKKAKKDILNGDNVVNTGKYKPMIFEMLMNLVMSYPSLYSHFYQETADSASADIEFILNDLLLAFMIFIRIIYFVRWILSISVFSEPRAQRVCEVYGCDANNLFAIKS